MSGSLAIQTRPAKPEFGDESISNTTEVLDSTIHWVEHGQGAPIVFLHGNPTSSFLWRKVFDRLRGRGRLLAVDLIGFGESGKPAIDYSLEDHQRYLDAWFDALDLRDVTIVAQDYGAAFGVTWARRNPERVRALLLAEPVIRPIESQALPPDFVSLRAQVLQDGLGEEIILRDNRFVTELLPSAVLGGLDEHALSVYEEPFPTPESRRPILVFPRALPVDAKPQSTVDFLAANEPWLATSPVPKVLLTFDPGFLLTPQIAQWARTNIANLTIESAGGGGHYVQEDAPDAIAAAVSDLVDVASTP